MYRRRLLKKTQAFSPKPPRGDACVSTVYIVLSKWRVHLSQLWGIWHFKLSAEYSNPSTVPKNTLTPSIRTASRPDVTGGCLVKDGLPDVFTGAPKAVNKELKLNSTARTAGLASQRQTCTEGLLSYAQVVQSTTCHFTHTSKKYEDTSFSQLNGGKNNGHLSSN